MKKLYIIFSINFLFHNLTFTQLAPDFTITGTDGNTHQLYADYLNQGKTVMFEIMFTICPPCNAFAGNLEPLYQTWGAGMHDVQFFSFSSQAFDSNQDVYGWELGHGLTFPGAGFDGGGFDVVEDFTDGTFGFFTGTPTFVVIAPDGTVTWNVGQGTSGAAKVQAIHDAIAATGAILPPSGKQIKGIIETPDGDLVKNVDLGIVQIADSLATSNENGDFDFEYPFEENITYTFKASKDENYTNGVSTYDLVLIAKHILNVELFTDPYQLIAADINNSGSISTLDLVVMRKVILGIDNGFFNNTSWRFELENCNFSNCGLDELFDFTIADTLDNLKIIAIKIGDVNFTADGQNLQSVDDRNLEKGLSLEFQNELLEAGTIIKIPFQSTENETITGFQFELSFDEEFLEFENFEQGSLNIGEDNFNLKNANEGRILTSWHDAKGKNLKRNLPLFYLNFHVKQPINLEDAFILGSNNLLPESYDNFGNIGKLNFIFSNEKTQFSIYPNPVQNTANLVWNQVKNAPIKYWITNVSGKILDEVEVENLNSSQLLIDFSNYQDGLYFISGQNRFGEIQTQKILKIE